MLATIGQRESERALQLGHLYSGEEALQVGLIDQLGVFINDIIQYPDKFYPLADQPQEPRIYCGSNSKKLIFI